MSKMEMVKRIIQSEPDSGKVAKLEKWARGTQHMQENVFNARNLRDYAMSGHVVGAPFNVSALISCVLKCMAGGCRSINFQYRALTPGGGHVCELNAASRDDAVSDVHRREGFTLYDFKSFIPYVDD